ncbi:MAG TPA: hypothetical protein VN624_11045, partial [Rhodanobacter sp.]|nr:hypothetical protein [Rhodanobacter sp.]
ALVGSAEVMISGGRSSQHGAGRTHQHQNRFGQRRRNRFAHGLRERFYRSGEHRRQCQVQRIRCVRGTAFVASFNIGRCRGGTAV